MGFDAFLGNAKTVMTLRRKLLEGRFPHALIFSGPEGIGKHTCAVMVAKALNCLRAQPGDFCDECSSCRKINSDTHADVRTISVEDDATQVKIAQIRDALKILNLQPLEGRNKVFILDPADSLNAEAANALLKGLEEPPENTFFILITVNVYELLLTVRSRCQIYNFVPLTLAEMRQHGITDELLLRCSRGSIGRAQSLDMGRLKNERQMVLNLLQTAVGADENKFQELLGLSAELGRAKQDFENRMEILAVLIADTLYIKEGIPEKLVNIDLEGTLEKLAERATVDQLIRMAEFLRLIESSLKSNVNRQMLTDVLVLTGSNIMHGLS